MIRVLRALALIALLALVGCSRTGGAVAVPTEDIPFPLARASQPSGPASPASYQGVYFVHNNRLARVSRAVPGGASGLETVVRTLLAGPTSRDRGQGITTSIPPATRLLSAVLEGDVAKVDLSAEFQQTAPQEEILLRVAQIVFTLQGLARVASVQFSVEGTAISVVTDGGTTVERPVTTHDYASVTPSG